MPTQEGDLTGLDGKERPGRSKLVNNVFFRNIKKSLDRDGAALMLGQWWHPLHFFPNFLSQSIASAPQLGAKTAISKILYQELGEGRSADAHEKLYVSTMSAVGFDPSALVNSPPLPATARLVAGYDDASKEWHSALGFIYATETVDLFMVGSLGAAVTRVTGERNLPWVDIHIAQEPDHVEEASRALYGSVGNDETDGVLRHADTMWELWNDFFTEIDEQISQLKTPSVPVAAVADARFSRPSHELDVRLHR